MVVAKHPVEPRSGQWVVKRVLGVAGDKIVVPGEGGQTTWRGRLPLVPVRAKRCALVPRGR